MSRTKNKTPGAGKRISMDVPVSSHAIWDKYRVWIFLLWIIGLIAIFLQWGNF
jgi:hypothetical protein